MADPTGSLPARIDALERFLVGEQTMGETLRRVAELGEGAIVGERGSVPSISTRAWSTASPATTRRPRRPSRCTPQSSWRTPRAYRSAYELGRQLQQALVSRAGIAGQAKGVLMAQSGVSPDEAFELVRRASQRENRKLREMAAEIVRRAEGCCG